MKSKFVRFISAMALAITMGVTAIAGTVQAADEGTVEEHTHVFMTSKNEWYDEVNSECHVCYEQVVRTCRTCTYEERGKTTMSFESHDLHPLDFPLKYRCSKCGYTE